MWKNKDFASMVICWASMFVLAISLIIIMIDNDNKMANIKTRIIEMKYATFSNGHYKYLDDRIQYIMEGYHEAKNSK